MMVLIVFFFAITPSLPVLAATCDAWNSLDKEIRDNVINRKSAREKLVQLDQRLLEEYSGKTAPSPYRFPIKGYGPKSIGNHGKGYQPSGYDFYDGNRHGGHPAHDLFIHDATKRGIDDGTGNPAEIVAFADGVVVAVNTTWQYPSKIRGGKYVWIFNADSNRFYYYAHLSEVMVSPGDMVKAGDIIGLLGRTGKNAWPKRSPTHLHFMCLSFDGGRMAPHNTYHELLGARLN